MENIIEIENEPPSKRQKLETDSKEYQDSGLSFPSEKTSDSASSSSVVAENEEAPSDEQLLLQNDEEDDEQEDEIDELDAGSSSEDENESEDSIIEASEVESKDHESVGKAESSPTKEETGTLEGEPATASSPKRKKLRRKKTNQDRPNADSKLSSTKILNPSSKSGSKKASNLRKNIKDILKSEHLGEETLAAQREEAERRQRMNLKLQQQQQQLMLLRQQQAQLMKDSAADTTDDYSGLSVEEILSKISRTKTISVSIEPDDRKVAINRHEGSEEQNQRLRGRDGRVNEEIVLSSDEDDIAPRAESVTHEKFPCDPGYQYARRIGHFGGTVMSSTQQDYQQHIISISSGEEEERNDDFLCDKEVESLEEALQRGISSKSVAADSDDDCVVISPTPEEDEGDKDEKNQDELNIPDEFGRVLVNVGHPDDDPDIFLAPQVSKVVKPHQIGGIRFLYDNVVESVDRFNTSSGFGCILAHSMGLGKTIQAVSFCDVFLRASKAKCVLIIVPINTIQNWLNEFNVWLPTKGSDKAANDKALKTKSKNAKNVNKLGSISNQSSLPSTIDDSISETMSMNLSFDSTLNLNSMLQDEELSKSGVESPKVSKEDSDNEVEDIGEIHSRTFDVFVLNETVKTLPAREKIICEWANKGGVLLIGYEMYRMLALKKLKRSTRKQQPFPSGDGGEAESLDRIHTCLVDPGPDLVICDEGHRIKNSGASISQALKAIKTKRRVVLTGYPLQNNLMEYWCMVDFIRPNYLGSKVEFSNMFERPISNGQCLDSTSEDRKIMRFRSHVLHSLLEGFVQRRSHAVLQNALPDKHEWVFLLKMTPIQYNLYKEFIKYLRDNVDGQNAANPIKAFAVCCKIWNHPDALYNVVKKKQSLFDDLDLDEVNATESRGKPSGSRGPKGKKGQQNPPEQISYFDGNGFNFPQSHYGSYSGAAKPASENALSLDWAVPIFQDYTPGILENGAKFEILFEIIKETVAVKDKLLVFSQSLLSLDLIEIFLAQRFQWAKNRQYYRLDGSTTGLERERLINNFNAQPDVCVFLVSTRAGSLGINLTGANRVVVLDASWNPCHDCQAVCRIYRYGQIKPCQIYRFVSDCTLEKRIYDRQINKRGMSDRVVDEMNPNAQFKSKDVSSFLVLQHEHLDRLPLIKWNFAEEKYSDDVLRNVLTNVGDKLTQAPFEHESLLIDQKSQRLSATEKRLAHRQYLSEKKTASLQAASGFTYSRPSYAAYYPKDDQPQTSRSSFNSSVSFGTSLTNYKQYQSSSLVNEDKFEPLVPVLRSRGICIQHIVLKKDSFLMDPSGGPDMYLRAGEKVYVLRSDKGTYLGLTNAKMIFMKGHHANARLPGMNVPSNQELNKEQLQGLVYSFLKVPGQHNFNNDAYGSPSIPPTEQALPPSPSFFNQSKNHLQVTNARNNSGGDVTLWQPQGKFSSEYENVPNGPKPSSSTNSFNPNLERLSFLANRFPTFGQTDIPIQDRGHYSRSKSSHSFDRHRHQSPTLSGSLLNSNSISGNNTNHSVGRAEIELIPIRKSNSKSSGRSPILGKIDSRSGSPSNNQNLEYNSRKSSSLLSSSRPYASSRSTFDFSSSYEDTASHHPQTPPTVASKVLDVNPSFYNDFTITPVRSVSSNGSNSNSNGSESINNAGQQSLPSSRVIGRTRESSPVVTAAASSSSWVNNVLFGSNNTVPTHMSNPKSPRPMSTPTDNYDSEYLVKLAEADLELAEPTRLFGKDSWSSPSILSASNLDAPDFENSSQYYNNSSNMMSGNNSLSNLSSGLDVQESSSRNDNNNIDIPEYFPNQGV